MGLIKTLGTTIKKNITGNTTGKTIQKPVTETENLDDLYSGQQQTETNNDQIGALYSTSSQDKGATNSLWSGTNTNSSVKQNETENVVENNNTQVNTNENVVNNTQEDVVEEAQENVVDNTNTQNVDNLYGAYGKTQEYKDLVSANESALGKLDTAQQQALKYAETTANAMGLGSQGAGLQQQANISNLYANAKANQNESFNEYVGSQASSYNETANANALSNIESQLETLVGYDDDGNINNVSNLTDENIQKIMDTYGDGLSEEGKKQIEYAIQKYKDTRDAYNYNQLASSSNANEQLLAKYMSSAKGTEYEDAVYEIYNNYANGKINQTEMYNQLKALNEGTTQEETDANTENTNTETDANTETENVEEDYTNTEAIDNLFSKVETSNYDKATTDAELNEQKASLIKSLFNKLFTKEDNDEVAKEIELSDDGVKYTTAFANGSGYNKSFTITTNNETYKFQMYYTVDDDFINDEYKSMKAGVPFFNETDIITQDDGSEASVYQLTIRDSNGKFRVVGGEESKNQLSRIAKDMGITSGYITIKGNYCYSVEENKFVNLDQI